LVVAVPNTFDPGLRASAWRRMRPFAVFGGLAVCLLPVVGHVRWLEAVTAIGLGLALLCAVLVVPRLAFSAHPERIALVSLIALAWLRDAAGGGSSGYGVVAMMPVLWVALYGDRRGLAQVLAGVAVFLAAPLILIGGERYPETGWRGGPLMLLCCAGVGLAVQALLARERAAAARRGRLLGVMGDGVVITDGTGRVLEVNQALCAMTGYAADELLGRRVPLPSWPEQDHAALLDAHAAAIAAGGGAIEARLERKDGSELFVQITLAVDGHGAPRDATVIATVRDVTEQVRLREQLTSERDLSAAILDAMQEGFGVTRDREIREVNAALCRITGFTREQLIGAKQPFPFWPPELYDDIGALRDRIHEAQGGSYEVTFQRADGTRFIAEATTIALRDREGRPKGFLNTVRDITERKQHERAMQERSHQLAALAGMTRALAHAAPAEARQTVCETALRIAAANTASIWEADHESGCDGRHRPPFRNCWRRRRLRMIGSCFRASSEPGASSATSETPACQRSSADLAWVAAWPLLRFDHTDRQRSDRPRGCSQTAPFVAKRPSAPARLFVVHSDRPMMSWVASLWRCKFSAAQVPRGAQSKPRSPPRRSSVRFPRVLSGACVGVRAR
jgi:PAS domain S-box-containing protein